MPRRILSVLHKRLNILHLLLNNLPTDAFTLEVLE